MALRQPLPVDASTQPASTKALAEGDEPHREGPAVELEHEHQAAVAHNARELGYRRAQPAGDGRGVIGGEPVAVAPHPRGGPVEEAHVTLLG